MAISTIVYLIVGITGMVLNIIVAITINRDKSISNVTYKFMMHLALTDVEALFGIFVGPRLIGLFASSIPTGARHLLAYTNTTGFHAGTIFFVLVALSRLLMFTRKVELSVWFTDKKIVIISACVWLAVHAVYSPFFYVENAYTPMAESGWYAPGNSSTGSFIIMVDTILNYGSFALQILFNFLSLAWIINMRSNVMLPEARKVHKREVKLFVQCLLDSAIYVIGIILSDICTRTTLCDGNPVAQSVPEVFVLLNHIDCALLYLCFNEKLRNNIVHYARNGCRRNKINAEATVKTHNVAHRAGKTGVESVQTITKKGDL